MDLIEEYLRVVAALLPRGQREDIVAELRDVILTRKEAREEDLGRPLTEDEIEAVLREVGHPLVVAARYGEGPQHVVGPRLYPYWLFGMKVILVIQAVIALIVFVFGSLGYGDPAAAFGRALAMAVTGSATLIGFATAAAWVIERTGMNIDYLDNWRVKDLRAFTLAGDWNAWKDWPGAHRTHSHRPHTYRSGPPPRRPPPPPRPHPPHFAHRLPAARGVALIVWAAFLIMWWIGGFHILGPRGLTDLRPIFDPGALAATDWGAVKATMFWPVLAYVLAMLAQGVVLTVWPRRRRLHGLADIVLGAALMALVGWVWNAPALAPSVQVDSVAAFVGRTAHAFAFGPPFPLPAIITMVLVFTGFGAICRMVQGLFQALLPYRWRGETPSFDGRTTASF